MMVATTTCSSARRVVDALLLVAALLSPSTVVVVQADQAAVAACMDSYTRGLATAPNPAQRCDMIAAVALCLDAAVADLTPQETQSSNDYLALLAAQNPACIDPQDPGTPPTIATEGDNIAITVGEEKEVVIQRHRREAVSLFDLVAKVDACETKVTESEARITAASDNWQQALTAITGTHTATLEGKLTTLVNEQMDDKLADISARLDKVADLLCTPYQFKVGGTGECKPLKICAKDQYESTAPTVDSDRECKPYTACPSDAFETQAPTATSDRKCNGHSKCTSTQYEVAPGTSHRDTICRKLTVCSSGTVESIKPTTTSDRQCAPNQIFKSCKDAYDNGGKRVNGYLTITDGSNEVEVILY